MTIGTLIGSVADPDLFGFVHFGQPDPFHETDAGSKKSAKIMENVHKNQTKYLNFFFKDIKLMFNGHTYLPLNN